MTRSDRPRLLACGLSKTYRLYSHPLWRIAELLCGREVRHQPVLALQPVDFELAAGQSLGLIGLNGGGKTTLLKLLAGVSVPTTGAVERGGRLASLLELGTGFHPDFSGRDNLRLAAHLMDLPSRRIPEAVARMAAFAEVGEFIDRPLRTYSSGMFLRLAFSVLSEVEPEVLLLDEVLAVGDIYFRNKSLRRILELRRRGASLVLASHDLELVRQLCDRVLWLEQGQTRFLGPTRQGIAAYEDFCRRRLEEELREKRPAAAGGSAFPAVPNFRVSGRIYGSGEIRLVRVRLLDEAGRENWVIDSGRGAVFELDYYALERYPTAIFGLMLHDQDGRLVGTAYSPAAGLAVGPGFGRLHFRLFPLSLVGGNYFLSAGVSTREYQGLLEGLADFHEQMYEMRVIDQRRYHLGHLHLEGEWHNQPLARLPAAFPARLDFGCEEQRACLYGQWHARENGENGGFCWMGERAGVLLQSAAAARILRLCLRHDAPAAAVGPLSLTCRAGDWSQTVQLTRPGWQELVLDLPPQPAGATLQLELQADRTWSPQEVGRGQDPRRLSLAFREIALEERRR